MLGVPPSSPSLAFCSHARVSEWTRWDCRMKGKVGKMFKKPVIDTCEAKKLI